jgi:hypothetical protein
MRRRTGANVAQAEDTGKMATFFHVHGYAVGQLWYGGEGYKIFAVNLTDFRRRIITGDYSRATLRDALEFAVSENDGDFCGGMRIAQGELIAIRNEFRDGRRITIERRWPLSNFESLADYLHADPDWWPAEDWEEAA